MAAAAPSSSRVWLFGPLPDLILGCGVGYALLVLFVSALPVDPQTLLLWGAFATAFTGMPHYGATLVRVYEQRANRRRYLFFSLWATLAVWSVFAWGVYDHWVGSALLTVYLTWSPWHYTGQNYGLAVMFLRRGGVALPPSVKRPLYTSFVLSYALAFLSLHGGSDVTGYGPAVVGTAYDFLGLGLPRGLYTLGFPIVLGLYGAALAVSALQLWRAAPRRVLLPAGLLVATQAVWFSLPSFGLWWTGVALSAYHVFFLFIWIAIGHAVQYLWVTTYYAAGGEPARARLGFLGKTLLAGAAIWTVPAVIFSPSLIGTVSHQAGLYMLVAAAVNLHHFILDGAIWKLRDGPVSRILLGPPAAAAGPEPEGNPFGRRLIWGIAALSTVVALSGHWLHDFVWAPASAGKDWETAARAERALRWMGRAEPAYINRRALEHFERGELDASARVYEESLAFYPNADAWIGLAEVRMQRGDIYGALRSLETSVAIEPKAHAWSGIGLLREQEGDADGAAAAYQNALRLDLSDLRALRGAARTLLARGDRERAVQLLTRAAALAPDDPEIRDQLARTRL